MSVAKTIEREKKREFGIPRAIRVAAALGMAAGLLFSTACGGGGDEAGDPESTGSASIEEAASSASATRELDGNQWVSWRGPQNTGASLAKGLVDSWTSEDEDVVLWKAPIGGRSTPIIMNGRVYAIHLAGEKESWHEEVVALDADSGEVIWRYGFPMFHSDIASDRVGWTSMAGDPETGYVYAHGTQGMFACFDGEGALVWERSFDEEVGAFYRYGGRTHTPKIVGDLVIVSFLNSSMGPQGRAMHRYLAMDKSTGEIVYWGVPGEAPLDTTFSVPAVAVINGIKQLIAGNGDGWVYGMKAETGEKIWGFRFSKRGINASVIVNNGKVYALQGEDNIDNTVMGRVVCIDATGTGDVTQTHEVWRADGILAAYASPALAEGRLYVVDKSGNLYAFDAETGEEYWRLNYGREGWASPVWADGKIYLAEVDGSFHIIEAGESEGKILSSIEFQDPERPGGHVDIRGCAAIAQGRIYLMTRSALYCVGKKDTKQEPIVIAAMDDPGPGEGPATHLQIVPGEIHIATGETAEFTARLFDARGRLIGPAQKVNWSIGGNGGVRGTIVISEGKATFTPISDVNGQFGTVGGEVEVDGATLTAQARVRVNPDLPIFEDFESIAAGGTAPGHWIGASRVKFRVEDEDGNHVLRKTSDNTLFWRALAFIGPHDMSDYTVQADVRATENRRRLPEMGLINSRYVFDIRGNEDQLRIISWVPMPRVVAIAEYVIEPDVWYTMKCRVDYVGAVGIVRGKIWKRDEPEPEKWTIQLEDPFPNRNGSPGLACYSIVDMYYDNVKVTAN